MTNILIQIEIPEGAKSCKSNEWCPKYTEHTEYVDDERGTWGSCDIFGTLKNICDRHENCISAEAQAEKTDWTPIADRPKDCQEVLVLGLLKQGK